jgi:hypothetical protein
MMTLLLMIFLAVALGYAACGWLYGFAMVMLGRIKATVEVDDHMFKLGLCAILAAGFLYLGDKI